MLSPVQFYGRFIALFLRNNKILIDTWFVLGSKNIVIQEYSYSLDIGEFDQQCFCLNFVL